ncbi:MAG: hypothetical protein H6735_14050 [Alphaproteobacteria bacterium]|nr:hypothetical protein [Alphaproteobacteria bacterium]
MPTTAEYDAWREATFGPEEAIVRDGPYLFGLTMLEGEALDRALDMIAAGLASGDRIAVAAVDALGASALPALPHLLEVAHPDVREPLTAVAAQISRS